MTDIEGFKPSAKKAGTGRKPGRPSRTDIRPPIDVRTEDPRPALDHVDSIREAEEYARKLLDEGLDSINSTDEFYISEDMQPDGWRYEWKCAAVVNQENTHHMNDITRQGWRPVPVSRHPDLMPYGATGAIIKKGLALMEMPKIIVDKLKARQIGEARETLRNSDRQLNDTPANTAPRDEFRPEHGRKVIKEMMRPVSVDNEK